MSGEKYLDQTSGKNETRTTIDNKLSHTSTCSSREENVCGGEAFRSALITNSILAWAVKAGLAVLAVTILILQFENTELWQFYGSSKWDIQSHRLHSQHIRDLTNHVLEVFQVSAPVIIVSEGKLKITDGSANATVELGNDHATCQQVLVKHSFASSFGQPFVSLLKPPRCAYNRVSWNLTVVSAGKQFDRLGIVYLGDTEVFRTSTAEPTKDGIEWSYLKGMTSFLSLFQQEQKLIFDLGNLINDVYTAAFNVTLTASYFTSNASVSPADAILPISKRLSPRDQPSAFQLPLELAENDLVLAQNVRKAIFTIAATGQDEEEFWWSNVLQSDIDTFPQYGELYGNSPFREVQLYIDDGLAGVAWPFPTVFTGGIVPGLWRPIVGIDAFDVKEHEIDITPWLPLLCDGRSHRFSMRLSGLEQGEHGSATLTEFVGSYWWVTGKVFIWYDDPNHVTSGTGPRTVVDTSDFRTSSAIDKDARGKNSTLKYSIKARREFSIVSTIEFAGGKEIAVWSQQLSYSNYGSFRDHANVQENTQNTYGYDVSSNGYARRYSYPIYAFSATSYLRDNITILAAVSDGKTVETLGQGAFPTGLEPLSSSKNEHSNSQHFQATKLCTQQSGTGTYIGNDTDSTSFTYGATWQNMTLEGLYLEHVDPTLSFPAILSSTELYTRHVEAVNTSIVADRTSLTNSPMRDVQ